MRAGLPILAVSAGLAMMLGGCAEKSQISDRTVRKSDTAAWSVSSAAVTAFSAPGWTASGDKAAWEAQINARTQSQNEYAAR